MQENKVTDDKEIGRRIALLRKKYNMSQASLAEAVGISIERTSKYERGLGKPSVETAIKMAKVLNTTLDYIFLGSLKYDLGDRGNRRIREELEITRKLEDAKVLLEEVIDSYKA